MGGVGPQEPRRVPGLKVPLSCVHREQDGQLAGLLLSLVKGEGIRVSDGAIPKAQGFTEEKGESGPVGGESWGLSGISQILRTAVLKRERLDPPWAETDRGGSQHCLAQRVPGPRDQRRPCARRIWFQRPGPQSEAWLSRTSCRRGVALFPAALPCGVGSLQAPASPRPT